MKNLISGRGRVGTLVVVAGLALFLGAGCQQAELSNASLAPAASYPASASPRLVEIGISFCIPCAMMRPGLDELKTEYAGRLAVEIIDTLENPGAKAQYNAPYCGTQIYIAPSGKELYRHVGYASKQDILSKWRELGVDLAATAGLRETK